MATTPAPEPATLAPDEVYGWVTGDDVERHWAHRDLEDAAVIDYLEAAHEQCVAFLNGADPDDPPARYRLAQIFQARALARSGVANVDSTLGDGEPVAVFPMDWTVKRLLRPRRVGRGPR
ncbi:hypothetical protein CWIS_09715 [Cellulomonas sp. A375-1]|uniref:hypothetical protein n=1 Tax=Cellulomonas sp. A375-1 TaxID=1672219 RepID=UPI000652825C|nr:hypothetical protein [Cellulomonas sp. A375-1]KMM45607.1 hypothetical protein CWIS_09715 [Cellulomonas sp. A375-1]